MNILWHHLSLGFEWKLTLSSPVVTTVFQICWHIECNTLTASSFRIWNSSAGISSPPLALFAVCFLRLTWLHTQGWLDFTLWLQVTDDTIMVIWVIMITSIQNEITIPLTLSYGLFLWRWKFILKCIFLEQKLNSSLAVISQIQSPMLS